MKKIILSIIALFTLLYSFAQAPEMMNYQAVARDLSGAPLVNTTVNLQFDVLQGASTGSVVYSETQSKTTNQFGLFTAEIGLGSVVSGDFSTIGWGVSAYFLRITVNGDVMPATQLLSVPYSLYSKESGNGPAGLDGLNCWDTNGNGIQDVAEDINNDGAWNALDCRGDSGVAGVDGIGVNWLGMMGNPIPTPNGNDAYFNTTVGTSFIWNDVTSNWDTLVTNSGGSSVFTAGSGIDITGNVITAISDTSVTNELQNLSWNTADSNIIDISNGSGIQLASNTPALNQVLTWNGSNWIAQTVSSGAFNSNGTETVLNNITDNVGIGTNTPSQKLTVVSSDTAVASFIGLNPNYSAIAVGNTPANPNAAAGLILLTGSDTGAIGLDPVDKQLVVNNSTVDGHLTLSADSSVISYAEVLGQSGQKIIEKADTIISFGKTTNNVINVNQGTYITDSLYKLGNNSGNVNWVLANDGFGQAIWANPSTLGAANKWVQGTGNDIYNNTDSVGVGVVDPRALFHVSGGGLGQPIALFEKGGFLNASININHTGSNGSGINFQNGATTTSSITSSTANVLSLTSQFVEVGNTPKTGKFNVASSSSNATNPSFLIHETSNGFSSIKHTNGVGGGKYWITEAGINAIDANSGYSISYNNGSGTKIPFIVYGDSKVGVNNLAAPLASFHVMDNSNVDNGIASEGFSQAGKIIIARNNFASPNRGAILNGNEIGSLSFSGYGSTAYGNGPRIQSNATENFSNTANGSELVFSTIANGTSSNVDALKVLNDGTVEVISNFRLLNGAGTAGQVLTSDAAGNATWQSASGGGNDTSLIDADGDTHINVEAAPDQDVIHFNLGNSTGYPSAEYFTMIGPRLEVINSGRSVFVGEGAGTNSNIATNRSAIAIGYNALNANVSGNFGVAIGAFSQQNATASNNVSVGRFTLSSVTAATGLTAIGSDALRFNTSGSENTAVGMGASSSNTTGANNTSVGYVSAGLADVGSFNTSIGSSALYFNTSGNSNTAVGYQSLYNTTGNNNVGLGRVSGLNNTTGTANTFLGSGADASANNLTNATAIGANSIASQNNSLILGNNADVGIGTSTPSSKLTVSGSESTLSGKNAAIQITNTSAGGTDWYIRSGATGNYTPTSGFSIGDNVAYRFVIDSVGKVGIGTTSPNAKLDVAGYTETDSLRVLAGAGTAGHVLTSDAAGNATWQALGGADSDWTTGTGVVYNSTENVGIGTIAPVYKLDVDPISSFAGQIARIRNSNTASTNAVLQIENNGSGDGINIAQTGTSPGTKNGIRVNTNGAGATYNNGGHFSASGALSSNAGIRSFATAAVGAQAMGIYATALGTTSSNTYGVYGQNGSSTTALAYAGYFQNTNNTGSGTYGVRSDVTSTNTNDQYGFYAGVNSASGGIKYGIYTSVTGGTTNWAAYFASGSVYVGDGLVIPANAGVGKVLTSDATGNATWQTPASSSSFWNGSASYIELATSTDNVGIGSIPTYKLDVVGDINTSTVYRIDGTTFLDNKSSSTLVGATGNTTLTGTDNTLLGQNAGENSTSGSENTFLGKSSGNATTTGSQNVAIGVNSSHLNVFGWSNIAVGFEALNSNTTSGNTGVGHRAMHSNTTGIQNVAFGYLALGNNITSNANTAIGYLSLENTTGNNNTGLGFSAGNVITTGTNNTFIGNNANALTGQGNLTNATAIGSNAIVNTSNSLILGNNANVGIGTSSPTAKLDVDGTFKLKDGTQGAGKILTSDAAGNASWQNTVIPASINFSVNSSTTLIPAGTTTPLIFDNVEYDNGSNFTIATGVFTSPETGVYHIDAVVTFDASSTHEIQLQILRNGGTHKTVTVYADPTNNYATAHISADVYLPILNNVSIGIYQNSGGNINPTGTGGGSRVYFTGHLVR